MIDSAQTPPQTWCEIDLAILQQNWKHYAAQFSTGTLFYPAIKKQAYGHGLIEVAQTLENESQLGALAISTVDEAQQLRDAGIKAPILCMSVLGANDDDLTEALSLGVIITISNLNEAQAVKQCAENLGIDDYQFHLKFDSGMGRLGRLPDEIDDELAEIESQFSKHFTGLYTHLADAWDDAESRKQQFKTLARLLDQTPTMHGKHIHIGGSDAITLSDDLAHLQATRSIGVRFGIALYGYHPGSDELRPVMNFKSRVLFRRRAPKGTRISYGGTYTLTRESELALVGCGYGNGYPRSLSNKGEVLIQGHRLPILGRVCMDQFVCDVTEHPEICVGDEALLFGQSDGKILSAEDLASRFGTISYELLCTAGAMNPRTIAIAKRNSC